MLISPEYLEELNRLIGLLDENSSVVDRLDCVLGAFILVANAAVCCVPDDGDVSLLMCFAATATAYLADICGQEIEHKWDRLFIGLSEQIFGRRPLEFLN